MTQNSSTKVSPTPIDVSEGARALGQGKAERCYLCGRTAADLSRLRNRLRHEVESRYAKLQEALNVTSVAKEVLLSQLIALRGRPGLDIHVDGTREVNGLYHAAALPKDPEFSILLKPGGYVDRLRGDIEVYQPMGGRKPLSAYLEAAIALEERYLKAIVGAKEEIKSIVSREPEVLALRPVVVAKFPVPESVASNRSRSVYATSASNEILQDIQDPSRKARRFAAQRDHDEVMRAISGLPLPDELVEVSVHICLVCAGFLDAKGKATAAAIEYDDDDEDRGSHSDQNADDNPAEDWISDSND